MTFNCSDCGKPIYANDEEESVGGKHAMVWDDTGPALVARFVCMPCSNKYTEITPQMEGVREELAQKIEGIEGASKTIEDLENKFAKKD